MSTKKGDSSGKSPPKTPPTTTTVKKAFDPAKLPNRGKGSRGGAKR